MPSEHEHATTPVSDAEVTAVLGPSVPDFARGGYGGRFEEDAFDYPSSSASQAWSSDDGTADFVEVTVPKPEPGPESVAEAGGGRRSRAREESRWRHAAVRHRSAVTAVMAVATLVLLGGFGLALSTVSDTVTSDPTPGDTAQVSVPQSPGTQPGVTSSPQPPSTPSLPPDPTLSVTPGASVPPTQTLLPPSRGEEGDRGREDDDHADD
ncbi:hypothetical protein ACIRQQ_27075 [Streptomyces fuscichromogenes]|uniref:hypothetical protein n=1 Tax=Streptomyces fuscichromogenes TaxID=1324013 RepID=UPI003824B843